MFKALQTLTLCTIAILCTLITPMQTVRGAEPDRLETIYLDDMQDFYKECRADETLSANYDCRCLSLQYLDKIRVVGSYDRANIVAKLEKNTCPRTSQTDAREKMEEIPQAYLDEAQEFYDSCGSDLVYGTHYDCECLASKYLDERIEEGRFADSSLLKLNIAEQCPSEEKAAAFMYERCSKRGYMAPGRFEIEDYCSCLGNEYARLYSSFKLRFSPKLLINLQSRAMALCEKKLDRQ